MIGAAVSLNTKKQETAEAEYITLAKAAQESICLQQLLMDMKDDYKSVFANFVSENKSRKVKEADLMATSTDLVEEE